MYLATPVSEWMPSGEVIIIDQTMASLECWNCSGTDADPDYTKYYIPIQKGKIISMCSTHLIN